VDCADSVVWGGGVWVCIVSAPQCFVCVWGIRGWVQGVVKESVANGNRGSTTAITFCVDSYRQFAGESLVTLNFSKNVFHGPVFGLFVTGWVESDGPRTVYLWIGIIQLVVLVFTVPMFMFGKRARQWTARE